MYLKWWKWKRRESQAEAEGSWARGRRFGRTAPCCHACINLHCIDRFPSTYAGRLFITSYLPLRMDRMHAWNTSICLLSD